MKIIIGLTALILVAQLIPYPPAENPPVTQEVPASAEVRPVLQKACYDCHSNETGWPWYSHVIPTKGFVRQHVVEGREHLNFSTWDAYAPDEAQHNLEEVAEMVEEGAMPLASYVRMHPEADLSAEEQERIIAWARELMAAGEDGLVLRIQEEAVELPMGASSEGGA
jgi:hypothetical protein